MDPSQANPPSFPPVAPEAVVSDSGLSVASLLALLLLIALAGHTLLALLSYVVHYYDTVTRGREEPQPPAAYLRAFLGEWWFGFAILFSYALGWIPPRRFGQPVADGGPPVLLVHGYLMNRACMFAIYWRLRRHGFRNVYTINLWPLLAPVDSGAQLLAARLTALSLLHDGEPVYVVAHSMGGLATRLALDEDPELPVAKLITIGTPHHGTQMAYFGVGPAALQMRPRSPLFKRLAMPPEVSVVSISSKLDHFVFPAKNALFGDHNIVFDDLGHLRLLYSGRVFDAIRAELPRRSAYESWSAEPLDGEQTR